MHEPSREKRSIACLWRSVGHFLRSGFREGIAKLPRFLAIFVIVLHSPDGVAETGPCVCPPEKNARKLACGIRRDTFSSAV